MCQDCKSNLADHANLTYGIYICSECAELQLETLGPQYVTLRSLFKTSYLAEARWDEYSLRLMELGGNYNFRKFMLYYQIRCKVQQKRYCHKGA